MKFLVVIPTIRQGRPGFEDVMSRIRDSFTLPTDFRVLDGSSGKAQTLNDVVQNVLPQIDCDVYVTMDDDYIPAKGWQDVLSNAFEAIPEVGVLGLWLGESPEMQHYMLAEHNVKPPSVVNGVQVRVLNEGCNIPGAMLAFRKSMAIEIGPTPVGTEKYQCYEDAHRCARAWFLGSQVAYVDMDPVPTIFEYVDTSEYLENKENDIASAFAKMDTYMSHGLQPRRGLTQRLRGLARRVRDLVRPRA